MKLDLLTNATVVDDAIRFVSSRKSKDKQKLKSAIEGAKESNEPGYEDEDRLEEKQEERTGDITAITNQVF